MLPAEVRRRLLSHSACPRRGASWASPSRSQVHVDPAKPTLLTHGRLSAGSGHGSHANPQLTWDKASSFTDGRCAGHPERRLPADVSRSRGRGSWSHGRLLFG